MNFKIFSLILAFFLVLNVAAQPALAQNSFPESWLGKYQGIMYIVTAERGIIDSVLVDFQFLSTTKNNCWTYNLVYHSSKYGELVKDYQLIKPDTLAKYNYLLDEKDGIFILNTLIGNTLYCNFDVAGSNLTSLLRKENDVLYYEIITSRGNPGLSSQNLAKGSEEVYVVDSYQVFTTQFVHLKKIK